MYRVKFSRRAEKDKQLLKASGLEGKVKALLNILMEDPFQSPPRYEALSDNLAGCFSRRINRQHRLVYQVFEDEGVVKILRM